MTRQEAEDLAQQLLDSEWKGRVDARILSAKTIEKEHGWIFLSAAKEFTEGKKANPLLGNLPILVTKSAAIVRLPVSDGLEEAIRRYEMGLPLLPRPEQRRKEN